MGKYHMTLSQCHNGHRCHVTVTVTEGHMTRVTWGLWESKHIAIVVKCISSRELSENLSAAKLQWPELSQLSLCSVFDKENSIELPLDFLYYLYKCLTLTLYQSPALPYESLLSCMSINKKNKRKEKEKNIKYWLSRFAKSWHYPPLKFPRPEEFSYNL